MILVVGGGLAGTVAAARLIALGRNVTLVHDRPGATALHGGGWLLGGSLGQAQGRLDRTGESTVQNLCSRAFATCHQIRARERPRRGSDGERTV